MFSNLGDRIELDEKTAKKYLENGMIKIKENNEQMGSVYELTNLNDVKKERALKLFQSLAILRGGAKQAAYGTDVSPKVIIFAGLKGGI